MRALINKTLQIQNTKIRVDQYATAVNIEGCILAYNTSKSKDEDQIHLNFKRLSKRLRTLQYDYLQSQEYFRKDLSIADIRFQPHTYILRGRAFIFFELAIYLRDTNRCDLEKVRYLMDSFMSEIHKDPNFKYKDIKMIQD